MTTVTFAHMLPGPVHIISILLTLHAATCFSYPEARSSTQHSNIPRILHEESDHSHATVTCPVPQAVVFVVDSSTSVAQLTADFSKMKAFLVAVLDELQIPPAMSGIIRFEQQWDIIANMTFNKSTLLTAVAKMDYARGETLLSPALLAAQDLLSHSSTASFKHKTVVVLTDGNPNDDIDTKKSADTLRKNGIRVIVVRVGEPQTYFDIEEIVSTPVTDNIIKVADLSKLVTATGTLLEFLDLPCPCDPGLNASINLTKTKYNYTIDLMTDNCHKSMHTKNVSLQESLAHGNITSIQCMDLVSGYTGMVNLTCMDAQLFASHSCKQTCTPGNTNALLVFNKERILLQPPKEMYSGGVENMQCNNVIPGTVGTIQLICEDGTLLVEHHCVQSRCPAGLRVGIIHESSVAGLTAPEGGLGSGSALLYQCEDHFANTSGTIVLMCFDGELRGSAHCTKRTNSTANVSVECPASTTTSITAPCEEDDTSEGVQVWAVVVYCVITAVIGALLMFCLRVNVSQKRVNSGTAVLPLPDEPPPAPPLPSPPRLPLRSTGVQISAQCNDKQDLSVQTDPPPPIMCAELMRGTQRATDVVFLVDSSISIGQKNFQKAIEFLLEVVHYLEMPRVRAGLIQFHDKVPFPCFADITGNRSELEAKIKSMKFDPGETEMGPPLAQAAVMLENVGRLAKKFVIVLTDGNPNDKDDVRIVAARNARKGIHTMCVLVGERAPHSIVREVVTAPANRNVIHLHSYRDGHAAACDILAQVLETEKCVRRMKCTAPLTPYKVVPDIDAITGAEVMCRDGEVIYRDGADHIVHDGFDPWCPPHPPLPPSQAQAQQAVQAQAEAVSSGKPHVESAQLHLQMIELQKHYEANLLKAKLAQEQAFTELQKARLARDLSDQELTVLRKAKLAQDQELAERRQMMLAKLAQDQELTERRQMMVKEELGSQLTAADDQPWKEELAKDRRGKLAKEQQLIKQHKAQFYKRQM